ncbi:cysteinyl-tRNA synthetase [Alkalihalobacillus alcalophilus ATCC 27647 = CGMCC 1.3604]|uniref:Cysteine--tRNA ligase n=1 Tax=Alkalihalobacillus alcalophilus ATCC 27647 = CGMCC 1.3604 TaxID=1218173 RepID=A0A094YXT3_ALKAL|nr:cysteine--tRNA ligase [Alkalihalobacillus alcalophilus]KGA98337.1 cysteinyl-tRNA synthetase [Alkalihalobacillus alcalophilus ATCC 27647 = CGMCC 1.3604]MED1561655.1 cysteine--tRNA ligase [Alkalihalobacillus alcalophilus]THG89933.1 cysteinyl-tRNA synthetase [Alkalihalobacillus alcalophilus ATCC 27647 = CGMCC 1.3604]
MSIKLYNSLTKKKETFVPMEEGKVKMYVCGPTVYNYIHIGNARPPIVYDVVRNYLKYRGYDVHFVSNFTDVDDKIIRAAHELGEDVFEVANRFIQAYHEDTCALGVKEADHHPRVTETIPEIIDFIKQLVDKGYAYEADGDVYFRTRKFKGYGKLSSQSIDDLRSGSRVEVDARKEDPLDFALWKDAKAGEISWKSPWGDGRPGWHIECSAMVKKYLGDTIDIHAGGQDLTFPHHENEIAQSEALTGKTMANYWLHNGFINIDNEKMSKSLGNFVLAHDMIQQHSPEVIRFFMLTAHYRSPINFSDELLEGAKRGLERLKGARESLEHRFKQSADFGEVGDWLEKIEKAKGRFIEEMDDDFNSANGISVLFDLAKEANRYLREEQTSKKILQAFIEMLDELSAVLGISLAEEAEMLDAEIDDLIEERNEARIARNFARADEIRDFLKEKGIILEDTAQGVRWKRG